MAEFSFDLLNEKGTPVIYSLGQTAGEGQSLTLTVKSQPAIAWEPGAGEPSLANCHFAICFQSGLLFTGTAGGGGLPTLNPPKTSSTDEWHISGLLTHPDDGSDCFCVLWKGSEADPSAEHSFQLSGILVENGMLTQHVRTLLRIGTVGENGQPLFDTTPAHTIVQQLLTVEEDYPYDLSDIGTVADSIDQKIEAFRVSDHGFLTSDDLPKFIANHTSPLQVQVDKIKGDAVDLEKKLMGKITVLDKHEDGQVDLILDGMGKTDTLMTVLRDKTIPPVQARIKEGNQGWNFLQVGKESTIVIQIFPNPDFFNLHTEPESTTKPAEITAKGGATVSIDKRYFDSLKIDAVRSHWNIPATQTNNALLPEDKTDTLKTESPLELTVTLTPKNSTQIHLVPLVITCGNFSYQKLIKSAPVKLPRPDLTSETTPVSAAPSAPYFYADETIETLALHIPLYLGPLHVSPGLVEVGNVATGGAANLGVYGKVGIGTATPSAKLEVGFNETTSTSGKLQLGRSIIGIMGGNSAGHLHIDSSTPKTEDVTGDWNAGDLYLNNYSQKNTIINGQSGNVGIGTATPGFPLTFKDEPGDKISLSGQSGNHFGFGIQSNQLQIHTDTKAGDIVFGYGNSGSLSETMRIKGNGNVGIGTATPGFPLTFKNEPGDKISLSGQSGNYFGFGIQSNQLQIHTDTNAGDIVFGYGNSASLSETMRIKGDGNVGIGTNNPQAKLDVNGAIKVGEAGDGNNLLTFNTERPWVFRQLNAGRDSALELINQYAPDMGNKNFVINTKGIVAIGPPYDTSAAKLVVKGIGAFGDLSGYFSNHITALKYSDHSDARIKTIIGLSDNTQDLQTLMSIQITDYRMKDPKKGVESCKKAIGQQIEKVFPQAVSRITDVIPDIQQMAKVDAGWVLLPDIMQVGERVKLIFSENAGVYEVKEISELGFCVDLPVDVAQVFVYGREVDDFRLVDYTALSMLHLSATQALVRRVEALVKAKKNGEVTIH